MTDKKDNLRMVLGKALINYNRLMTLKFHETYLPASDEAVDRAFEDPTTKRFLDRLYMEVMRATLNDICVSFESLQKAAEAFGITEGEVRETLKSLIYGSEWGGL